MCGCRGVPNQIPSHPGILGPSSRMGLPAQHETVPGAKRSEGSMVSVGSDPPIRSPSKCCAAKISDMGTPNSTACSVAQPTPQLTKLTPGANLPFASSFCHRSRMGARQSGPHQGPRMWSLSRVPRLWWCGGGDGVQAGGEGVGDGAHRLSQHLCQRVQPQLGGRGVAVVPALPGPAHVAPAPQPHIS